MRFLLHVPKPLGSATFLDRWQPPTGFWDRLLATSAAIVLVSLAMPTFADEGESIAQDLSELRQQFSSPHQSGSQDFQQAVRDVAKDERRPNSSFGGARRTFNTPKFGTPTIRRTPPQGYVGPQPQNIFPDAVSHWGHPPHHRRPAPTPASRLRETAFELDRLAHGLEMAELYEGADTLRDTAEKLRQSARQVVVNPGPSSGGSSTAQQ